jgi:hypothetical protein
MRSYAKTSFEGSFLRLLVLFAVEVGCLLTLHRFGSLAFLRTPGADLSAWRLWLASTPPQDAVAWMLRLAATVCTWWLLATTGLYVAARLARIPNLVRALEWTTPRAIRGFVDRSLALSMVATLAGGTAAFAGGGAPPAPAPVLMVVGGQSGVLLPPGIRPGAQPVPRPQPLPVPTAVLALPPATPPARPDRHTVRPGENLWTIAASRMADTGITTSTGRIAPYWKELIQENRGGLRSGNPDLIFPGETVSLPPST